ncbi:ketopantoate reductase PanE/ApbA C terminal-domain-containing protein [Crassisporium funariophilum]|nr:ketopantoate reductase PanE/ApbA C terminal-domain-containing protein [Crassisporium funariophilum]
MHYHILGIGPIGCLVAHNLRRILPPAHTITLIQKTYGDQRTLLEKGAIHVEHSGVAMAARGFENEVFEDVVDTSRLPPGFPLSKKMATVRGRKTLDAEPIESLVVALKAQQTVNAMAALAPRLSSSSTIVLMQNGMGIYEELIHKIFRNPNQRPHFILASNTHGAFVTKPFHVIHAGVGSIEFGIVPDARGRDFEAGFHDGKVTPLSRPRLTDITESGDPEHARYKSLRDTVAALLLLEPLKTSWKTHMDLQLSMRRKLVVNAVINPLTALMGCRNGDLFRTPFATNISKQICKEASSVYAAQIQRETKTWMKDLQSKGVDISQTTPPPFPRSLAADSLEEEVMRVAELTKGNISSMLQDVRRGRITEVEYINGYLRSLGWEHSVRTPVNSTLCDLVKMRNQVPLDQML